MYIAVAPLGSGSKLEKGNKDSHLENSQFCAKALKFYNENRDQLEEYLEPNMCKIWSKYAEGKHKEGGHNDFSYVNHDLRKGGCRPWKDYWEDKHTCKEGRKSCDFQPVIDSETNDRWYGNLVRQANWRNSNKCFLF